LVLKRLLLLFVFATWIGGQAQTTAGIINGSERWQGEILLTGDVVVAKSGRLTVMPGCRVLALPNQDDQQSGNDKNRIEIIINGDFLAEALPGNGILFSSAAKDKRMGDWYGLIIQNRKPSSALRNVTIEYAFDGLTIIASNPSVTSSVLQYNFNSGIHTKINARPQVIDNTIFANGWAGLLSSKKAKPILSGNRISLNDYGVIILRAGEVNLGNLEGRGRQQNPGQNVITGNLTFAVDNHSKYQIYAQNNTWADADNQPPEDIGQVIYDVVENPGSGEVVYRPVFGQNFELAIAQTTSTMTDSQEITGGEEQVTDVALQIAPLAQSAAPAALPEDIAASDVPAGQGADEENDEDGTSNSDTAPPVANTAPPAGITRTKPVLEWQIDTRRRQYIGERTIPEYPSIARQTRTTGQVIVEVVIDEGGLVTGAKVLKSDSELLNQAALDAAVQTRYLPMTVNGVPSKVRIVERYLFSIR
jgi:TonB family protein